MKTTLRLTAALLAFAAATASAHTPAVIGATVHTVGPDGTLENATILINDGRIAAVGTNVQVPAAADVIDASGKIVTPGLFSPMGQLGLSEVGAVAGTNDAVQRGDDFSAGFAVADAYNQRSVIIPISRIAGITRALIAPPASRPGDDGHSSRTLSALGSAVHSR